MKSILVKNKFKNGKWKKTPENIDCSNWKHSGFRYADYIQIELDDSTVLEGEKAKKYLLNALAKEEWERAARIKKEAEEKLQKQLESIPDQYKDLVLWLKDNLRIDLEESYYNDEDSEVKVYIGEVEIQ